ncbi:MAG TPA: efflux RND transporter permease subunit [Spirochaetota bacterium]|nr:efflux RND transporter permease subunit [Spirochaetota bacterium]HPI88646.1 efflux RND transporter permease subunit [Spirochaetota bacterium]HPR49588.1 efflux RND transporter permease subunit [Spirochaetota bacterium]
MNYPEPQKTNYMQKLIELILGHPRAMLVALVTVTLISVFGIFSLEFENSYETGMPQGDPTYLLGEETKKLFKDTETYLLVSIEPAKNRHILSHEVFVHINKMVDEINEYKTFNKEREDSRLKTILEKGNISIIPPKKNSEEAQGDDDAGPAKKSDYPRPCRERNIYDYAAYRPVSWEALFSALDPLARDELLTIIKAREIETGPDDEKIPPRVYKKIVEAWEDLYLYKSVEIVEVFSNPVELSDILGTNDTLRTVKLIEKDKTGKRLLPVTERDFRAYTQKLFWNPVFKYNYYSPDDNGEIKALAASMLLRRQKDYEQFTNYLWAMINKYDHDPVHLYLQGSLVFDKFINDYNQRDLQRYIPLVLLVVIMTFYLNFRTIRGVILPTLTVVFATIITMGFMGFLGVKLTIVSTILPPLLIAIGSSYSIHIFNQYLLDLENIHGQEKKTGLKRAMFHISNTVFLTGLTTFISFLTMVVNKIPALKDLGLYAAFGTAASVAVSSILIISSLYLLKLLPVHLEKKGGRKREPNRVVMAIVSFLSRAVLGHHRAIIVVTAISIIIGTIGITLMTTETSATSYFKKDSYIRRSLDRTNELFRGTYILNVVFSPGEGKSILDHDFLQYIEDVRQWLDQPGQDKDYRILYNSGFGDFIKRMNMAMNNEDPAFYTIPDTMSVIDYMELFSGDDENYNGMPDMFETTISPGFDKTNLMVRIGTLGGELMTTKKSGQTIAHIKEYLDRKSNPNGYTYLITGGPTNFIIVSQYIVKGQIQSIFLSILIIGILMFLLFRSPHAGIVSIIPISCTIFWVFGFMGFSGIPLGMAQSLISTIAIGIGIDDTIHFMNTMRKHLRHGLDLRSAVRETHHEAGLAIVYTSVAIVFGFSVLMFSHFMPILESGLLVTGVMIASTLADLVILPSIVLTFGVYVHRIKDWKLFRLARLHYLLVDDDEN